jgi:hypothetical protein
MLLRYNFGYDFEKWESAKTLPAPVALGRRRVA